MFVVHISFLTQNADQVKSIAMLSGNTVETAKDLPTATDQGYNLDFPIWGGIVAPKGIPEEARTKLEQACEAGMKSDAFVNRMGELRMPVIYLNGKDFKTFVDKEFTKKRKIA